MQTTDAPRLYCAACDRNVLDRADHLHVVNRFGDHLVYCDAKCRNSFGSRPGAPAPASIRTVKHTRVNDVFAITATVDLALRTIGASPRAHDPLHAIGLRALEAVRSTPAGHPQWLDARQREHAEALADALLRGDFARAEVWAQWVNDPAAMEARVPAKYRVRSTAAEVLS